MITPFTPTTIFFVIIIAKKRPKKTADNTQLQMDNDCTEKMVWLETAYHGHPAPNQEETTFPLSPSPDHMPIDGPLLLQLL